MNDIKIRSATIEYDELLKWAEDKIENIELLYQKSDFPDVPEL